ncbi:hypothetical protein MUK42_11859 [Musa troglodytarum]|uniref:RRM domain-containing protein n=1 Tax=Musa troglodytarum TaxID=320322 RepID=A0A9E7GPS3_9LILI|nr:hypothetical protein MUK42_11859 [Musa troglodytarum]
MNLRGKRRRSKSDPFPASLSKRLRRQLQPDTAEGDPAAAAASSSPSLVMVSGLPADCTVLELKSRLEMFGPISRTRIDVDGRGYVTFRSDHAAEAAIAASLDPTFGLSVRSKKVLVVRTNDPLPIETGVKISLPSKLLRAEIPLSRLGRSKKLNPGMSTESTKNRSKIPHTSREIIAYHDLF